MFLVENEWLLVDSMNQWKTLLGLAFLLIFKIYHFIISVKKIFCSKIMEKFAVNYHGDNNNISNSI